MMDNCAKSAVVDDWLPEAQDAAEVKPLVDHYGCAIWRGLLDQMRINALIDGAQTAISGLKWNGALRFPPSVSRETVVSTEIDAVFKDYCGNYDLLKGQWESIFLFADNGLKPTVWHQECETVPEHTLIAWVALSDCGVDAPGLSVVLKQLGHRHPIFMPDDVRMTKAKDELLAENGWPVITPGFKAGDAVFLNRYTIHRTHITPEMTKRRLAYKVTAVHV